MTKIRFTKMHGAGNDYIYVDTMQYPIANPSEVAVKWSDRHKGIGSDGLVLIGKSPVSEADFSMRIFNADGSEAMMCGNASRCIGKYLYEKGMTTKTRIQLLTLSGVKTLNLLVTDGKVQSVTVDMGKPVLADERFFVTTRGLHEGTFVSMGNPHYVIFTPDVDMVETMGRTLEKHPAFPQHCNIEFAQVDGRWKHTYPCMGTGKWHHPRHVEREPVPPLSLPYSLTVPAERATSSWMAAPCISSGVSRMITSI